MHRHLVTLITTVGLTASTSAAADELLDNGSFEDPVISEDTAFAASLPGWDLESGEGVFIHRDGRLGVPFEGAQMISLDTTPDAPHATVLSQTVETCPGGVYTLSLAWSPQPGVADDQVDIWFNGELIDSLEGDPDATLLWQEHSWTVEADRAQSMLSFADVGAIDGLGGLLDAVSLHPVHDEPDADCDGVPDHDDYCPDTVIPEATVPSEGLGTNRWALIDDDYAFDTNEPNGEGPGRSYDTTDTAGCSCEQIIEEQGLGNGHSKHGCSIGAMDNWVAYVDSLPEHDDDDDEEPPSCAAVPLVSSGLLAGLAMMFGLRRRR